MDSHLEKLRKLIDERPRDVRMIDICGVGGIGKRTITKVIYQKISHAFEGRSFLANVGEISNKDGLVLLQKFLLSQILLGDIDIMDPDDGINKIRRMLWQKKILIVIDDVVDLEQLNKLVGNHDWFGLGSRIIITRRNKHLLKDHGVDKFYEVGELNYDEAFRLFSLTALGMCKPPKDYLEMSNSVAKYVGGLPLFLQVFGLFLSGKTIDEWESTLEILNRDHAKGILDDLKISLDRLKTVKKGILERKLYEALRKHNGPWEAANVYYMLTEKMDCRSLSVFFLVLEAVSVVLDLCGEGKRNFLVAAVVLSALAFIITISASIVRRPRSAAFRTKGERQLGIVEVVFYAFQFVTTFLQLVLTILEVAKNYINIAAFLPLALPIISVWFAFKKEKRLDRSGKNHQV